MRSKIKRMKIIARSTFIDSLVVSLSLVWFQGITLAQNTTEASKKYHEITPETQISYSGQVVPIIQAKCLACHSESAKMGGFVLADYESLMKGGSKGKAVVPGHSQESRLLQMVEGDIQPRMPLGGALEEQEINIIRYWIDQGAKLDQETSPTQSLKEPVIPNIKAAPLPPQVGSVAYSPDGSIIAAGKYGEVVFFDATTRQKLGKLSGLTEAVRSMAFSPDGKYFATGAGRPAQEGEIKIWKTGKEFWNHPASHTIKAHRDCVYAVAFSPDNKLLASTSYDHMIYLWDLATGQQVKPLKEHTDSVFDLAFSPDGKWLASGGADRTVKLWNIESGKRIFTLGSSTEGVNTIAFHPSSKWIAASGFDRTIRVWDLTAKAPEPVEIFSTIAHETAILRLAYSPNGEWLVSTGWDKQVKVWDAKTMEQVRLLPAQTDWVLSLCFSPNGKQLILGRYDGSIGIYDTANYQLIGELLGEPFKQQAGLKGK